MRFGRYVFQQQGTAASLLFLFVSLGTGRPWAASLNCTLDKVNEDFVRQKYGAAAHQIQKYLRSCPQSSMVYQKLGFAYYYSGDPEEASEALHRATQFRTAELHVSIAQGYHFEGNHAQEIEEAQKALTEFPNLSAALLVLGRGYDELGDRSCSEHTYLENIRFHPKESQAFEGIASLYLKSGDYQKSEVNLRKAAELDPKRPEVFHELGRVYQLLGRPQDAQAAYAHAAHLTAVPIP